MLEFEVMPCFDVLCKIRVCAPSDVFVDDWCLNLMLGYIVVGYVKLLFFMCCHFL